MATRMPITDRDLALHFLLIPLKDLNTVDEPEKQQLVAWGIHYFGDLIQFGKTDAHELGSASKKILARLPCPLNCELPAELREEYRRLREAFSKLRKPMTDLSLTVRAMNCLELSGILTLGEIAQQTEDDLLSIRHLGVTTFHEISEKLDFYELKVGMSREDLYEWACRQSN